MTRRVLLLVPFVVLAIGACSGGDDDGGAATSGGSSTSTGRGVPPTLPTSEPGHGAIALGSEVQEFDIESCAPTPARDEPEGARTVFALKGSGKATRGGTFTVEVQRFQTKATATTFTDTISYRDPARILQAQRIEVDGVVSDPRDPNAATPLLLIDGSHLAASGTFSVPGGTADDGGLIAGRLDATCTTT